MKSALSPKTPRPSIKRLKITAVICISALSLFAVTGCDYIKKQTSDAWFVTYEITVTGAEHNKLDKVSYLDAPSNGEPSSSVDVGTVPTQNSTTDKTVGTWTADAAITVGEQAQVSATPQAGSKATCRILLDSTKEIASAEAPAGQPVTCTTLTPAQLGEGK